MLIRRRPRPRVAADDARADQSTADVERALRLGWAVAETFGRLRVYRPAAANKRNDPSEMPRFSFSNGDLSGAQSLEVSCRRMVELAAALDLQAPTLPEVTAITSGEGLATLDDATRKSIHGALETWSRAAWIQLNVRSAALGRAMTYGGSMADTYWYMAEPGSEAFLRGRQSVDALLRPQRLRRMRERMDELGDTLSAELCDAIGHSLGRWMYDARKAAWATADDWRRLGIAVEGTPRRAPPEMLHFNLMRQVRTWRNLLFEARQPLDYVSPAVRRRANLLAGTATIVTVILVSVLVGLAVFGLLNLAFALVNRPEVLSQVSGAVIEAVSVLLTVASTLAVLIAGLLSRASRAVELFDAWLEGLLLRREIRKQTTVAWNDPPRPAGEGS